MLLIAAENAKIQVQLARLDKIKKKLDKGIFIELPDVSDSGDEQAESPAAQPNIGPVETLNTPLALSTIFPDVVSKPATLTKTLLTGKRAKRSKPDKKKKEKKKLSDEPTEDAIEVLSDQSEGKTTDGYQVTLEN